MQIAEELRRNGKTRSDSLSFAGERFANSSSKNQPSLRSLLILIKKSCKCCLLKVLVQSWWRKRDILRTLTKNTTTSWFTTRASLSSTSGEVKTGRISRQHCCCSENCHLSEKRYLPKRKQYRTASSLWPSWTTDKTQWQVHCLFGISEALLQQQQQWKIENTNGDSKCIYGQRE